MTSVKIHLDGVEVWVKSVGGMQALANSAQNRPREMACYISG